MAPSAEKEYTMEEVSQHNTAEDCWMVIGNTKTGTYVCWLGRGKKKLDTSRHVGSGTE